MRESMITRSQKGSKTIIKTERLNTPVQHADQVISNNSLPSIPEDYYESSAESKHLEILDVTIILEEKSKVRIDTGKRLIVAELYIQTIRSISFRPFIRYSQ